MTVCTKAAPKEREMPSPVRYREALRVVSMVVGLGKTVGYRRQEWFSIRID